MKGPHSPGMSVNRIRQISTPSGPGCPSQPPPHPRIHIPGSTSQVPNQASQAQSSGCPSGKTPQQRDRCGSVRAPNEAAPPRIRPASLAPGRIPPQDSPVPHRQSRYRQDAAAAVGSGTAPPRFRRRAARRRTPGPQTPGRWAWRRTAADAKSTAQVSRCLLDHGVGGAWRSASCTVRGRSQTLSVSATALNPAAISA